MFGDILGNSQAEGFPEVARCHVLGASLRDLPVAFVRGYGAASLRWDTAKRTFVKIEFVGILLSDYFSTFYQPDLEEQKK